MRETSIKYPMFVFVSLGPPCNDNQLPNISAAKIYTSDAIIYFVFEVLTHQSLICIQKLINGDFEFYSVTIRSIYKSIALLTRLISLISAITNTAIQCVFSMTLYTIITAHRLDTLDYLESRLRGFSIFMSYSFVSKTCHLRNLRRMLHRNSAIDRNASNHANGR